MSKLINIFIIYDSCYGNTQQIAEAVKAGFGVNYNIKLVAAKEATASDIENIDLLIVGSPTHGGWYTEFIKAFIESISEDALQGIKACSFDTSIPTDNQGFIKSKLIKLFGNAAPRIAKRLKKKGATIISSESFWVLGTKGPLKEGEVKRAAEWAGNLAAIVEQSRN